ncbi:MAG: hypothetical protein HZA61_15120 [Candidatus Eisenbacteria bacterium]|uniref:Cell division protein FtsL n=1 Tax=Eiseniibacteriota bacterium TaxID=2212470 RepID=A0A933WC02_UNCEI|nr:hypothetical protein [Candidatus Eisenbacteria bacterium]
MTKDWRRNVPSWRTPDRTRWVPNKAALLVVFVMGFTLVEVWSHATVQSLSVEVGRVSADLKHENDRTAWLGMELDRASSRSALLPVAASTGLRPVDPGQIVSLPEDYLSPSDGRMRETGSSTLLASAARALQSLVPDAAARGRHVN